MSSIQAKLHTNTPLSDGRYSVKLYIYDDLAEKPYWFPLGLSCFSKEWDKQKGRFRKNFPNYKSKNLILHKKELEAHQIYDQFVLQGERFDYNEFKVKMGKGEKRQKMTVLRFVEQYMDDLGEQAKTDSRKAKTLKTWRETKNLLVRFMEATKRSQKITFRQLDPKFLHALETYMRGRGNKDNTISLRFRVVKRAYKLAIAQGFADKERYPFGEGKYRISKNVKTTSDMPNPLDDGQLKRWKDLDPPEELAFAHKMFLCSYYMNGMNFKDMSLLKYSKHFSNGRIAYSRSKTSSFLTIKITKELQHLLDWFKGGNDYVFPVLNEEHVTGTQISYRVDRTLAEVNKGLRKICPLVGKDPSDFTFYNARDTFTNVLLRNKIHLKVIQQLLGHKSITTTMIYTEKFGIEELDDAVAVL